jgi:hypothetical protein
MVPFWLVHQFHGVAGCNWFSVVPTLIVIDSITYLPFNILTRGPPRWVKKTPSPGRETVVALDLTSPGLPPHHPHQCAQLNLPRHRRPHDPHESALHVPTSWSCIDGICKSVSLRYSDSVTDVIYARLVSTDQIAPPTSSPLWTLKPRSTTVRRSSSHCHTLF